MEYKISIIIPVYNTEKYLSRCIESALNQNFDSFEIIIINDGSTDNSGTIADNYSSQNHNINVIHKKNKGLGFARNTGLEYAKGEYILFLDSDDYIDKGTLEKVYNTAKNTKSDITVFNMRKINESDNSIIQERLLDLKNETINIKNMGLNEYFKKYFFPYIHGHEACNKLYKMSLLNKSHVLFDKNDLICSEDLLFNLKLLPYVKSISSTNHSFYNYMQRENSLMNTQYRQNLNYRFTNLINMYNEYIKKFNHIDLRKEISVLNFNLLNAVFSNDFNKYGNDLIMYVKELKYANKNNKMFKESMKNIAFSNACQELLICNNFRVKTSKIIKLFCLLSYINIYLGAILWYLFMKLVRRKNGYS